MQDQEKTMTAEQRLNLVQGLFIIASLSVIVFLRRRIGFRILDSGWYLGVALGVFVIGLYNYNPREPYPHLMEYYAGGIVLLGAIHRGIARAQFRRGTAPHSYSMGVSHFETRRTPRFLREHRIISRLFDPCFTAASGMVVQVTLSPALGNWLIFSGCCLLGAEVIVHTRETERDMDMADGLIAAGIQADRTKQFTFETSAESGACSGPVSTGLGSDVKAKMKTTKKK